MSSRIAIQVLVDGEIELPPGAALKRIEKPLKRALTFEDQSWQKRANAGWGKAQAPRYRRAYRSMPNGSLRIARGAWKILKQLARENEVELLWESKVISPESVPARYNFSAQLRSYQEKALEAILNHQSGVVVIPTGGGKTMVALAAAAVLQTSTLFIVHTRELLRQVCSQAEKVLGVKPGELGAGKWTPAPFSAALIQTLARRDLSEIKDRFALIIVDEAHHAPAQTYCEVLPKFPGRYRVALTATPYRRDGLHKLLWLQFGEIIFKIDKRFLQLGGKLLSHSVHPIPTEFDFDYDENYVNLISALCNDRKRQRLVVDTIASTHRPGGCSLVLTERVEHAERLFRALREKNLPVGLLHGRIGKRARAEVMEQLEEGKIELLVATLSLIGEGWDHPPLDTLYLTVPNGNKTKTTQALGRILRPFPGKPQPRVFDFVDYRVGILRSQWMVRGKVYGLSSDEIRAALQLPPAIKAPSEPNTPKLTREQLLSSIRAIQKGEFERARQIIRTSDKKSR